MAILGTLEVRLHSGKHLKNMEFLGIGRNDPYAIVSYETQKQKSKTIYDSGSNCVWNESFFFQVEEKDPSVVVSHLVVEVFDKDKYSSDDVIGQATIPLGDVLTKLVVPESTYDLVKSSKGKNEGQIVVSLKFLPKESEKPRSVPPPHISSRSVPLPHNDHHQHQNGYRNQHRHKLYDGPYGNYNEGGWK